jgi:RHS repeat-associated protein
MGCLKISHNYLTELKIVSEKKSVRSGKTLKKGRSYLEARYYNPRISNWLSVDPLATDEYLDGEPNDGVFKSMNINPYNYVSQNPVNMIDPTGMYDEKSGKVEKGDNLTNITKQINESSGKKYTVDQIAKANKIKDANKIEVGQTVLAPGTNNDDGDSGASKSKNESTKKESTPNFNIDKAVSTLNKNALSCSAGKCAKYVRWALESGGVDTSGHPLSAKDYDDFLKKKGFFEIPTKNYTPKMGDVVVMEAFKGARKNHPHGHVQMFNGNKWVSDFKQNGFWPGSDYRGSKPKFSILKK